MSDERHDESFLQPAQLQALRALHRDEDPGRLLEERTVHVLRDHGLLAARAAHSRALPRPWAWAAAAAIAFFIAGFTIGRGTRDGASMAETDVRPVQRLAVDDAANRPLADDVQTVRSDSIAADGAQFVVWF